MDRNQTLRAIDEAKIIVILRGLDREQLIGAVGAMREGGIKCVEVTFNAKGNPSDETVAANIAELIRLYPDMHIGAGTVLNRAQVDLVKAAGGEYIISPDVNVEVIEYTRKVGLVSIPGALTPSEATSANRAGADYVKLFPNAVMGPAYLKAIAVPLSHIKFLAVGGVNENNLGEYMRSGAAGIGVASAIVDKTAVKNKDWKTVAAKAKAYVDAMRESEKE